MNEHENPYEAPKVEPYDYHVSPMNSHDPQQPKKNSKAGMRIAAVALCCSLLGGIIGAGGALLAQKYTGTDTPQPTVGNSASSNTSHFLEGQRENSVIDISQIDTSKVMTASEVYAANVNSTVGITTSITTNFWGHQSTSAASGSGFIISDDGYILTNFHVIDDSSSISVALYNGDSHDAKLVGYDESNDIAVLKIEAEGLTPVILGDSDNLNVGDSVVAIGNPLGELTFSLTAGTISAKDREVTLSSNVTMNLLQTDCAINSGNSGGALFNLYGEVIGVTNAKYSSSSSSEASIDNIGFAIPINSIRSIVESIIEKGYVSKPYLGISVIDVTESYQIYGLPQGAAIQAVNENSPAEKAGLKIGDIVTMAGDQQITCGDDLVKAIASVNAGDKMVLTIYRKGQTMEITVTIEEQIQSQQSSQNNQSVLPFQPGRR